MTDTTFVDYTTPVPAAWLNDVNDHVYNNTPISPATTVHPATVIANTPAGTLAATTVQAAIDELETEKAALAGSASQVFSVGPGGATGSAAVRQDEIVGRNKIIGGNFTTNPWQRGTSFTAPATGTYTADRFLVLHSSDGVVDILKAADAPTAAEAGMYTAHCLHADVTTADAALAAGQSYVIQQHVEGLNAASLGFGQAGTRYVTLSFWHKHTKTGTYCVSLRNSANNRSYVAEYTQTVTDTWEKATLTIPVDTSGTWLYDTGIGLRVVFALASGSTFQTAAGSWAAGVYVATSNQVNALDSTSNNFKLALIQLEAGSVASAFETRSTQIEAILCQRYYEKSFDRGVAPAQNTTSAAGLHTTTLTTAGAVAGYLPMSVLFKVKKRLVPTTITFYNPSAANAFLRHLSRSTDATATTAVNSGEYGFGISVTGLAAWLIGEPVGVHWTADAEL